MKSDSTNIPCRLLALPLLALLISTGNTSGEILDTLAEYGNAANATSPNPAGNAHGADFTNAATGSYIITAAGTDIWGGSDHGLLGDWVRVYLHRLDHKQHHRLRPGVC